MRKELKKEKLYIELAKTYLSALTLEETKRKYSRSSTSFRGRNLMEYLYSNGNKSVSELSEYLKITKPSTTELINKLERLNYVKRVPDKEDERKTLISLTRRGELVSTFQISHRDSMYQDFILHFDELEKEILLKGFSKLNEVLEKYNLDLIELNKEKKK